MKKLFIAAVALILASCAQPKVADLPFENTCWKLVELNGDENPAFAAGDSFTFKLDGEAITGKGSVNRFFGGYELSDEGFKVGDMGMTRMMGPNIELEDAYVQMLHNVDGYEVNGEALLLLSEGAPVARFEAFEPSEEDAAAASADGTPVLSVEEALQMQAAKAETSEE